MSLYKSKLSLRETEAAIKLVKDDFERNLTCALNLERVSAPLFVPDHSGLNDDLDGKARAVTFPIPDCDCTASIVHSLAKWKRMALARYGFAAGEGLYTDMNAIRADERLDDLHSIYVDQWDWEKVISKEQRNVTFLKGIVEGIVAQIVRTKQSLKSAYSCLELNIKEEVFFITSQQLHERYPLLSPKERENAICKEYKTVFLMQIGGTLSNGQRHDMRAPDYDDWTLNGDILFWYEPLKQALEISSMGIRVDKEALLYQLKRADAEDRKELMFHKALLNDELPLSIGGGIGQSRLCLLMLEKVHIGEVQASIWSKEIQKECREKGIELL